MWMVRRLAVGMSTATKSTPLSIKLAMKATLRAGGGGRRGRGLSVADIVAMARKPAPAVIEATVTGTPEETDVDSTA
jgi:hypothetical protein